MLLIGSGRVLDTSVVALAAVWPILMNVLHATRKSWDGAELTGFDGWSKPKWVPPGEEVNKIGYYRAFRGKLHYKVGGDDAEIDVHTIITWQGRWYITHLRKFKK